MLVLASCRAGGAASCMNLLLLNLLRVACSGMLTCRGGAHCRCSTAGVVLTMARFGPKLALTGLQAPKLTAPFAKVVDPVVTNPWLRSFLDLECFVLRHAPCMRGPGLCAAVPISLCRRRGGTFGQCYQQGMLREHVL